MLLLVLLAPLQQLQSTLAPLWLRDHPSGNHLPHPLPCPSLIVVSSNSLAMVLLDQPPLLCNAYDSPPVGPLILQVSPPPCLSDPEEFFYDLLPHVTLGFFAAAYTFFLANRHKVTMLECPSLDAFIATSPGAVVSPVSALPTLVLSQGGQLLIDLEVARLMSLVEGFAIEDGPTTIVPC